MRWFLKKLLGGALLFPSNVFLLLFFAWVIRDALPRTSRVIQVFAVVAAFALSCGSLSTRLVRSIERLSSPLNLKDPQLASRADAIVVLGAGRTFGAPEYGRDVASAHGFLRLRYGVDLQHATGKPILVSGGTPDRPGKSEAALMDEALRESFGTQAKWLEGDSVDTAENARLSFRLLAPQGVRRVFLVTQAVYMERARRSFERAGFEVVPAPMGYLADGGLLGLIPSAIGVEMTSIYLHEVIGLAWYRMMGEI